MINGVYGAVKSRPNDINAYMKKVYAECISNTNAPSSCLLDGMISCSYSSTKNEVESCLDDYYQACL